MLSSPTVLGALYLEVEPVLERTTAVVVSCVLAPPLAESRWIEVEVTK
jgi:hypothetical protein